MSEFIIGAVITTVIAVYLAKRRNKEHTKILIAIYEGYAEPDENGNIGWLIR
jgi:hypothetical protein